MNGPEKQLRRARAVSDNAANCWLSARGNYCVVFSWIPATKCQWLFRGITNYYWGQTTVN